MLLQPLVRLVWLSRRCGWSWCCGLLMSGLMCCWQLLPSTWAPVFLHCWFRCCKCTPCWPTAVDADDRLSSSNSSSSLSPFSLCCSEASLLGKPVATNRRLILQISWSTFSNLDFPTTTLLMSAFGTISHRRVAKMWRVLMPGFHVPYWMLLTNNEAPVSEL